MTNTDNAQPGLLLGHPLFSGIEQEGVRRGMRTLFVGSPDIQLEHLQPYLDSHEQVYLGGNRGSEVNWELARVLMDTRPTQSLTVDVTDDVDYDNAEDLLRNCGIRLFENILVTMTLLMLDTEGRAIVNGVEIRDAFDLYRKYPHSVQIKLDWGTKVLCLHREIPYVNDFIQGYASDVALPNPLL